MSYQIIYYRAANGKIPFLKWLNSLKDKQAQAKIRTLLDRVIDGHLGTCKRLTDRLSEFKIYSGPGYRIYATFIDKDTILVVCGGTKATQKKDIKYAHRIVATITSGETYG